MNAEPGTEISKKDLLREMDISYGQFYRWKRMGLIPEVWFHRRSTFTGQETFLPRDKVMERIARIQELKDHLSLEEIFDMLSPDAARHAYTLAEVSAMGIFQSRALEIFAQRHHSDELRYPHLLALTLIQKLLTSSLSEALINDAVYTLLERFSDLQEDKAEIFLVVAIKDGVTICALHTGRCLFDGKSEVAASVNLNVLVEELNLRLRNFEAM